MILTELSFTGLCRGGTDPTSSEYATSREYPEWPALQSDQPEDVAATAESLPVAVQPLPGAGGLNQS